MLIPGLLILLLAVVLISALVNRAQAAEPRPPHTVVSTIQDGRITESSGLVVSRTTPDLAYTINDSGNAPQVFAIEISTGSVVGVTTLTGYDVVDAEALSADSDGQLWVADTGDNLERRGEVALYSFAEPARVSTTVTPSRWPIRYEDGPRDVETLLINPVTDAKYLVSKSLAGGQLYALPPLSGSATNTAEPTDVQMPAFVTDGAFSPDGAVVVLRSYGAAYRYDTDNWTGGPAISLPAQPQGETLAVEPGGQTFLVGSEGKNSQLLRIKMTAFGAGAAAKAPVREAVPRAPKAEDPQTGTILGVTAVVVACVAVAAVRQHRKT